MNLEDIKLSTILIAMTIIMIILTWAVNIGLYLWKGTIIPLIVATVMTCMIAAGFYFGWKNLDTPLSLDGSVRYNPL